MVSVENLIADHSGDHVDLISPTALLMIHGEKDTAVPYDGEEYSERLQAFLRAVPTIKAAAPAIWRPIADARRLLMGDRTVCQPS